MWPQLIIIIIIISCAFGLVPRSSATRNLHYHRKSYASKGIQTENPKHESQALYQHGHRNQRDFSVI